MKITIDTKADSEREIKAVMKMLNEIYSGDFRSEDRQTGYDEIREESYSPPQGIFSLFDDDSSKPNYSERDDYGDSESYRTDDSNSSAEIEERERIELITY